MDTHHPDMSLKFYNFLCDVIGTKEVVHKRRQIYAVKDLRGLPVPVTRISSGSRAEGLDLKGSDYDEMMVDNRVQVFERLDQVKSIDGRLPLVMDTDNVKAGFTKLLICHPESISYFSKSIDKSSGYCYLSSKLLLHRSFDKVRRVHPGDYIHGPCITTACGGLDTAFSLHCTDWISQALQWVHRTKYSWASDTVIRSILSFGVLFVPIGSKTSHDTDLEWRISFSYAEKQLIFCLNHVQLLCYALLKILLSDIINKIYGDLLCSYFMKTIMFWLCEETNMSYWRPENMLSCFMLCFKRLVYCVENKTCLHYFIPENNLFEYRFENQHGNLLSTLHQMFDLGWTCLLQTETLQPFRNYFKPILSSNISLSTFYRDLSVVNVQDINRRAYTALMKRCIHQTIRSGNGIDIYTYFMSSMNQSVAKKYDLGDMVQGNNRFVYRHFQRRLANLLIGLNHDCVSGLLFLASFFFVNKQYTKVKTTIDFCFTKFCPERRETFFGNDFLTLQPIIVKPNEIGPRYLKMYTTSMIKIGGNCSVIPNELKSLLSNDSYIYMTSLSYAHFLNFLFYHTIGDKKEKMKSLCNLELTGRNERVVIGEQYRRTDNCLHIAANLMLYDICTLSNINSLMK